MLLKRKSDGVQCLAVISDARTNVVIQQLQMLTNGDPYRDPRPEALTVSVLQPDGTKMIAEMGDLFVRPMNGEPLLGVSGAFTLVEVVLEEEQNYPEIIDGQPTGGIVHIPKQFYMKWEPTASFLDAYEVVE